MTASDTQPRLIEVEEFLADPGFIVPTISPDGTRIAYLAPHRGRRNVWIRGVDQTHDDAVPVTHDTRCWGYAALVGIATTPDLFAAAVDYVGVSDLVTALRALPPFTRRHNANSWYRYVGDPDVPEQEAEMRARSPITMVDRLRFHRAVERHLARHLGGRGATSDVDAA
jgi:hypothetical protein